MQLVKAESARSLLEFPGIAGGQALGVLLRELGGAVGAEADLPWDAASVARVGLLVVAIRSVS